MISNKKEFIKKVNTLLYSFVWKGNEKVERAILRADVCKYRPRVGIIKI